MGAFDGETEQRPYVDIIMSEAEKTSLTVMSEAQRSADEINEVFDEHKIPEAKRNSDYYHLVRLAATDIYQVHDIDSTHQGMIKDEVLVPVPVEIELDDERHKLDVNGVAVARSALVDKESKLGPRTIIGPLTTVTRSIVENSVIGRCVTLIGCTITDSKKPIDRRNPSFIDESTSVYNESRIQGSHIGRSVTINNSTIMNATVEYGSSVSDSTVERGAKLRQETIINDSRINAEVETGQGVEVERKSVILKGAKLHTGVNIEHSVIGEGSVVEQDTSVTDSNFGPMVKIGIGGVFKNTRLLDQVRFGANAKVYARTVIESCCEFGDNTEIASGTQIRHNVKSMDNLALGPANNIGQFTTFGDNVKTEGGVNIGSLNVIGSEVKFEEIAKSSDNVTVQDRATIGANAQLGEGSLIVEYSSVPVNKKIRKGHTYPRKR